MDKKEYYKVASKVFVKNRNKRLKNLVKELSVSEIKEREKEVSKFIRKHEKIFIPTGVTAGLGVVAGVAGAPYGLTLPADIIALATLPAICSGEKRCDELIDEFVILEKELKSRKLQKVV